MASTQVLAGFHAVVARLRHAPDSIKEIYVEASRRDKRMQTFIEQAERAGCRLYPVGMERLDGLARGTRHQGVVALAEERQLAVDVDEVLDVIEGPPLLLILDGVTDPHNLGACLRTADAAGVRGDRAARPRGGPEQHRPARGLRRRRHRALPDGHQSGAHHAQPEGPRRVAGRHRRPGQRQHAPDRRAPAHGLGHGGGRRGMRRLTRETCDQLVNIPMLGSVESLNVSVASAVCLYETVRQRQA